MSIQSNQLSFFSQQTAALGSFLVSDTISVITIDKPHSPAKATVLSAVLPGAGAKRRGASGLWSVGPAAPAQTLDARSHRSTASGVTD